MIRSTRPSARAVAARAVLAMIAVSCSSGRKSTAPTTVATSPTAATAPDTTPTTSTSGPTAAPASTAPVTPTTGGGPANCHSSQLSATLTNGQGAAGTIYSHLTFTNKSSVACTMSGYPGVSFVDGAGHQIGAPVPRMSGYGGTVTLAPVGGTAAAVFAYHDAYVGTSPLCMTPVPAAGLRVYPPGETAALFVADPTTACGNPSATGVANITAAANPASLPG